MPAAPKAIATRSRLATQYEIRLGDDTGAVPAATDVTDKLISPTIHHTSGGEKLDQIEMVYNLGKTGERIVDTYIKAGYSRQVEVVKKSPEKGKPDVLMAWGEITQERKSVGPDGEEMTVIATVEPYHFGPVFQGPKYRQSWAPYNVVTLNREIVFNPDRDGNTEDNQSQFYTDADQDDFYWVDPDSMRTAAAKQYGQGNDVASAWELQEIVNAMMWHCNPDEDYITNPSLEDFTGWITSPPTVRNLRLPLGRHLNEYLDLILHPYGYSWHLTYKYDDADARVVSIKVFKLHEGESQRLLMQKPNDTRGAKSTLSNVTEFRLDTDIAGTANKVIVFGDYVEREVTIELYRGWPEADDALTAAALTQSTGASFATHRRAWRLWVANEAGDYCNTRTVTAAIPTTPLDLSTVFGASEYTPVRRQPMDCLTHETDDVSSGSRRQRPPYIEYYTGSAWSALPNGWGETVLTDQIGVYFAGDAPPAQLIAMGSSARLRITCTIRGDMRVKGTANRVSSSPNLRTAELVVILPDKFKDRRIQSGGSYASTLGGTPSSEEQNDTTAIATHAETIRAAEDAATVRASFKLFGIHTQLKIGQLLKEIYGRNISLNTMSDTSSTKKYMQIMGVVHNVNAQETTVDVESFSESYKVV